MENKSNHLLEVKDLHTSFNIPAGEVKSVNGISFTLDRGKVLGIVGESGSGKSVTAYSIMQILEKPGRVVGGSILFNGQEMLNIPHRQLQKIRGAKVSIIFQDAMSSLNPVWSIGNQLMEAIKSHPDSYVYSTMRKGYLDAKKKYLEAKKEKKCSEGMLIKLRNIYKDMEKHYKDFPYTRALEMLRLVGINSPEKRMKQYPFEFSGGMLQRIMIAMALSGEPELIIADEPTTALDVTIQAQILELLKNIQAKMGMGIIIITHDLGVVAQICDYVNVMYAGRIVEKGTVQDIFYNPQHEYTKGLMNSIPKVDVVSERLQPIKGNPVDVFCLPTGCSFVPRCDKCMKVCLKKYPAFYNVDGVHETACFNFVKKLFDEGKISEEKFNKYLETCYEGNQAFTPISRIDVYNAYKNFITVKEKNLENIKTHINLDKTEIETLKFHISEAKKEYQRSKKDFRHALRMRRISRGERYSIDKNDLRKKSSSQYKQMKSIAFKLDENQFNEYLEKLVICTTIPNYEIKKENVIEAKKAKSESFKKSFKCFGKSEETAKTKHEHDQNVSKYFKLKDEFRWAKYVSKKTVKVKNKLKRIYSKYHNIPLDEKGGK